MCSSTRTAGGIRRSQGTTARRTCTGGGAESEKLVGSSAQRTLLCLSPGDEKPDGWHVAAQGRTSRGAQQRLSHLDGRRRYLATTCASARPWARGGSAVTGDELAVAVFAEQGYLAVAWDKEMELGDIFPNG